jgi:hypothetical protein
MARISGLEKKEAPWHVRWFYGVMRKMSGKDITPGKVQMRFPGLAPGSDWRHNRALKARFNLIDVLNRIRFQT